MGPLLSYSFFFFNDTATTEIYPLSLHDALPIYQRRWQGEQPIQLGQRLVLCHPFHCTTKRDRKSTRLNSSHSQISYAVFCLKKKKDHASIVISRFPIVIVPLPDHHCL